MMCRCAEISRLDHCIYIYPWQNDRQTYGRTRSAGGTEQGCKESRAIFFMRRAYFLQEYMLRHCPDLTFLFRDQLECITVPGRVHICIYSFTIRMQRIQDKQGCLLT